MSHRKKAKMSPQMLRLRIAHEHERIGKLAGKGDGSYVVYTDNLKRY